MFDGETFGQEMVAIVKDYVDRELAPLRAENKALNEVNAGLERRIAELEAKPEPDLSGFCQPADVSEKIDKAISAIPVPEKPAEIDMDAIKAFIAEEVSAIPVPENGKDCDMAAVKEMVSDAVKSAVDAIPAPKPGDPGKDGVGLADALRNDCGELVLTMTDGTTRNLGRVNGKDGKTFTLDDFDIEPLDERSIKLKFTQGDACHSFELEFPVPIYRGVYQDSAEYVRGDMVTWAGSCWHCDEPKGMKPGAADSGWRLAVKSGRAGRDAGDTK